MPEGKVTEFSLDNSKVYAGYRHKWSLYVPAQYDGKKPIALMMFLDGERLRDSSAVARGRAALRG